MSGLSFSSNFSNSSASPVTSPIAPAENTNKDPISVEEWSDAGSDEEKIGGRMFWSEEDNLQLISAWLNNSNDPIDGNSKKGSHYWKQVADISVPWRKGSASGGFHNFFP